MMVWIHGGGYVSGDGSGFLPDRLVARGVVVVTVNYRLGVLGFLAHPSLAAESPDRASGDYGLMDQQLALRWVRQNIARFGGDPGNVTLFGESAGGDSVQVQLASPTARGLFQRAIVESGGYSGSQPSLATAEAAGASFAARIGCPSQTAACLRHVPVSTLLANQPYFDATPVIDGKLLTRSVTDAFARGLFNRVPVIEGSNHDEFRFFLAMDELAGQQAGQRCPATGARSPGCSMSIPPPPRRSPPNTHFGRMPRRALRSAPQSRTRPTPAKRATPCRCSRSTFRPTSTSSTTMRPRFFPGSPVSFPLGAFHAAELEYLFTLPGYPVHLSGRPGGALERRWSDCGRRFAKTGDPGLRLAALLRGDRRGRVARGAETGGRDRFRGRHHCDFWSRRPWVAP